MSFYFKWWSHLIIVSVDVDESKVKASVPRVIIVAVVLGIILVVIVKVFTVVLIIIVFCRRHIWHHCQREL